MSLCNKPKNKGQGALEYLLLCGIVAFVSIISFAPNGLLSKVGTSSGDYYSKVTRVIQGENPQKINGGWCPWQGPFTGLQYRSCECPAPAFGGALCPGGENRRDCSKIACGDCGNGNTDGQEECDRGNDNTNDPALGCHPYPPAYNDTCNYCALSCESKTVRGPYCGDGAYQSGFEDCDGAVEHCTLCRCDLHYAPDGAGACVYVPYCGDGGGPGPGEQCDEGSGNRMDCDAPYNGICSYCSASNCQNVTKPGESCNDGIFNKEHEQCDPKIDATHCGSDCTCLASYIPDIANPGKCVYKEGCGNNIPDNGEECDGSAHCTSCVCDEHYDPDSNHVCAYVPYCGDRLPDAGEQCDNGSSNGVACAPSYGQSCQYCSSSCQIVTIPPTESCGDGKWTAGSEECEGSANCSDCRCINGTVSDGNGQCVNKCGNGKMDQGETCDLSAGSSSPYQADCTANYGETCNYCTSSCTVDVKNGGSCGDAVWQKANEQCDKNAPDTPYLGDCKANDYDSQCTFCRNNCTADTKYGPRCGDGAYQPPYEECEGQSFDCSSCKCWNNTVADGQGGCKSVQTCGDSKKEGTEVCDNGSLNGVPCTATYTPSSPGNSCTYCNASCTAEVTIRGGYCGDNTTQSPNETCDQGTGNGKSFDCFFGVGPNRRCLFCTTSCRTQQTNNNCCIL